MIDNTFGVAIYEKFLRKNFADNDYDVFGFIDKKKLMSYSDFF